LKLHQLLAVIDGRKKSANRVVTDLYHALQKPAWYAGLSKVYQPLDDEGTKLPPEAVRVQRNARADLEAIAETMTGLLDLTAQKDWTNASPEARGTVTVDGTVLIKDAPVTYLLSLKTALTGSDGIKSVFEAVPTLDPAETWLDDEANNGYRTDPVKTHRNEKRQKPLVLFPATDRHPAQTQLVTEDVLAGYWERTLFSGAIKPTDKERLLSRLHKLVEAISVAIEQANQAEVETRKVTAPAFQYLLG